MEIKYSEIHKEVIELCKKGDNKAQYKLYKLYSKAMFNICYRMMNSREEAEDLLQESFSEAFKKLDSFRYESAFGAWLKRIVINKCINALKKKKAEILLVENFHTNDVEEEAPIDEEQMKLSVQGVMHALGRLPQGFRVIFSLYMLEGYDHGEIAEIMGISESTSKSQLLRAKRKLKELLVEDRNSGSGFFQHNFTYSML